MKRALIVACLLSAGAAHAEPRARVGVLVVAERPADRRALEAALARAPRWVSPRAVTRRVRAASQVELDKAKAALERADKAALNMARGQAVQAAREALAALDAIGGALVAPKLVARINVALASAELLHPPDAAAARAAFRAAIDADPALKPDPRRYAPRVLRVLAAARAAPSTARAPSAEVIARMRGRAKLERLLLLRARRSARDTQRVTLELSGTTGRLAHADAAAVDIAARARALLRDATRSKAAPVAAASTPPSSAAATASTAPAAAVTQPSPPAAPVRRARPWYRRWWVWTLIGGAVAAAAGVSIGVAAANSGDTPPGFDLRLRFPGR